MCVLFVLKTLNWFCCAGYSHIKCIVFSALVKPLSTRWRPSARLVTEWLSSSSSSTQPKRVMLLGPQGDGWNWHMQPEHTWGVCTAFFSFFLSFFWGTLCVHVIMVNGFRVTWAGPAGLGPHMPYARSNFFLSFVTTRANFWFASKRLLGLKFDRVNSSRIASESARIGFRCASRQPLTVHAILIPL